MIDAARMAKFKRQAPLLSTKEHLDRILATFPGEHREEILATIEPYLSENVKKMLNENKES